MHGMAEGRQEACHGGGDTGGGAVGHDLDPGEAGHAFYGDEDVFAPAVELGQIAQVDMDIAEGCRLEGRRSFRTELPLRRSQPAGKPGAPQRGPDRAAREAGIDAAVDDLGDVVEAEAGQPAQVCDDRLLDRRRRLTEVVAHMAAVRRTRPAAPAPDRRLGNAKAPRQNCNWIRRRLDLQSHFRGGRGIGVQPRQHRNLPSSRSSRIPRATPEPSNQSAPIKHPGGRAH